MQPQDPFQFIRDTNTSPRGPGLGNTKQGRIMVVAVGGAVLLVLIIVMMSLFSASGNKGKEQVLTAMQQQTELIRVSKLGMDRARGSSAKNLAATTYLSIQSDQTKLSKVLSKQHVKINTKKLALGKNAKTDAALTDAEQANKFDSVFITTLQKQLVTYQKTLQTAYDNSGNAAVKQALKTQYANAGVLAKAQQ